MSPKIILLLSLCFHTLTKAQRTPVGKTYLAEVSAACEKANEGGCMVYERCALAFTVDSVDVWTYTTIECSPQTPAQNTNASQKKRYSWSLEKSRIYIPGFSQKGLYLNGDQLLGSAGPFPQKSLHFWEQPQPQGKQYILQTGLVCKGNWSLHSYLFGFFAADSVDIWTYTETDRIPQLGKRLYNMQTEMKTYAWGICNEKVYIDNVEGQPFIYSTSRLAELLNNTRQMEEQHYLVRIASPESGTFMSRMTGGYVNQYGDTVIPIGKYKYCYEDTIRSLGVVQDSSNQFLAIDNWGRLLFKVYSNETTQPDSCSEGLFRIYEGDVPPPLSKTGYADPEGNIVIKPQFALAEPFCNGRARVTYEFTGPNGMAQPGFEGKNWFLIDKTGRRIDP